MACILEAHRGVGTEYPENTLPAFHAAFEQGYGMVELDTKFTADDQCVILHDDNISRMARHPDGTPVTGKVNIDALTLDEVRALDFGLATGEAFRGTKICTLDEVLDFSAETGMPLKFDNVLQWHRAGQFALFCDAVKHSHAVCGFTSDSIPFIAMLRRIFPDGQIHYDGSVTPDTLDALAKIVPPECLTVWLRFDNDRTSWNNNPPVNEVRAAMVHRCGRLGVWLLDKPQELFDAENRYHADLAETDGSLKPSEKSPS